VELKSTALGFVHLDLVFNVYGDVGYE